MAGAAVESGWVGEGGGGENRGIVQGGAFIKGRRTRGEEGHMRRSTYPTSSAMWPL